MSKISKVTGFNPKFEENKTDLLFNKVGLQTINRLPNIWELNEQGDKLININNGTTAPIDFGVVKIGHIVPFWNDGFFEISEIKLMRLADVTEEMALRSGVELIAENAWKHYSPEKFYPRAVLKKEPEGFPRFTTAIGSFHSLWCKKYDIMEIYANPWIWQFTCKHIKTIEERSGNEDL